MDGLTDLDMSRKMAARLNKVREVYVRKVGEELGARENSMTEALTKAIEQLAVDSENERIRLRELEEQVAELAEQLRNHKEDHGE